MGNLFKNVQEGGYTTFLFKESLRFFEWINAFLNSHEIVRVLRAVRGKSRAAALGGGFDNCRLVGIRKLVPVFDCAVKVNGDCVCNLHKITSVKFMTVDLQNAPGGMETANKFQEIIR